MMNTHNIEIPTGLSAILYGLYHVEKVERDESYKNLSGYLRNNLDEEEKQEYKQALDWATKNPEFDYNSILPNLRKTNEEVVVYLKKYRQFSKLFGTE